MAHKAANTPVRYFDEKSIPKDVWDVLRAAALLNIGEFRVFELAYRNWFGTTPREKTIERYFVPYMFNKSVPGWVRHFCREIIDRDAGNSLDPRLYGIQPKLPSNELFWKGTLGFVGIIVTFNPVSAPLFILPGSRACWVISSASAKSFPVHSPRRN